MSSNIRIIRKCANCSKEFTARTLKTIYCSHYCNQRHYKQRKREEKLETALKKDNEPKPYTETLNIKQFLSIEETALLLGASKRTIYRMIADGSLKSAKLGARTIIKRLTIDKLFK